MKKAKAKKLTKPVRSTDIPATAKMLSAMEDRLNCRITSQIEGVKSEIHGVKSEVHGMKSEFHEVKSEIHGLKSEIHEVKAEVHGLKSDIHGVKSEVHRVALLVEEQNARNKYVMDGYAQIYDLLNARFGGGEPQA